MTIGTWGSLVASAPGHSVTSSAFVLWCQGVPVGLWRVSWAVTKQLNPADAIVQVELWFSTFSMLRPFNPVPRAVVAETIKLFSL